jgi:hypothetical protein
MSAIVWLVLVFVTAVISMFMLVALMRMVFGGSKRVVQHPRRISDHVINEHDAYIPMTQNDLPVDGWVLDPETGLFSQDGVIWQNDPAGQLAGSIADGKWGARIREEGARGRAMAHKITIYEAMNGISSDAWKSRIDFLSYLPDEQGDDD